ncbi:hypothetical protein, partial [Streptomyces sp. NPDC058252]|uniref:hypothetical protein n=1 Tax=Streptomyces sp. NPDC058252 TaxID=3346405 RepID=UPI0036EBEC0C
MCRGSGRFEGESGRFEGELVALVGSARDETRQYGAVHHRGKGGAGRFQSELLVHQSGRLFLGDVQQAACPRPLAVRQGAVAVSGGLLFRTKTVSYVVIARWSVHGAGYVELDCSGRLVGSR